jgi:hypothetical protein
VAEPATALGGGMAGGSTDLVTRIMSQWLTERLGQAVITENRSSAGTNLATQTVVNAPPDGYTLLLAVATNPINITIYESLPFNFLRDIAPVAGLAEFFAGDGGGGQRSGPERRGIRRLCQGQSGQDQHRLVRHRHHQPSRHRDIQGSDQRRHRARAHRGGAPWSRWAEPSRPASTPCPNSLPHIQRGTLRALPMTNAARSRVLPDVPTVGETIAGFDVTT